MIETINSLLGAVVPIMLIAVGGYFTVRLRFFYILHPLRTVLPLLRKDRSRKDGISPFRAVTVALAGTLGVGNIVGVATAITLGGFGAVFWMWVSALFAMVLKYAEIVLAVNHRRSKNGNGFFGGAPFYIRDLFDNARMHSVGTVVSFVFALFLFLDSFSTGSIVQINAAAGATADVCGIPAIIIGIISAVITFIAVMRGIDGVSALTEWMIPILSVLYIIMSLAVILIRFDALPSAFSLIFSNAFSPLSAAGGVIGFITSRALRFGSMRGLLSNEAGCGTAPTAHAAANTNSPVEQGFFGIFEVFVDTIVLCTLTAVVIIINFNNVNVMGSGGIMLAIRAYSSTLGKWSEYLLAVSVSVFGIATVICRAYYGTECLRCIINKPKDLKTASFVYLLFYSAVTVIGSVMSPDAVWGIADLSIGCMTLINVVILFLSRKEVVFLTNEYFRNTKKRR